MSNVQDIYITLEHADRETWIQIFRIREPHDGEQVLSRLEEEYGHPIGPPDAPSALLVFVPPGDPDGLLIFTSIPRSATFKDLRTVFGGALEIETGPVQIWFGSAGGYDAETIIPLKWVVQPITYAVGKLIKLCDDVTFARECDGVARWRNTGIIDSHLIDTVRGHGVTWDAKLFSRIYAVDDGERGALLRAAGYEWRYLKDRGGHYWYLVSADDWTPGI